MPYHIQQHTILRPSASGPTCGFAIVPEEVFGRQTLPVGEGAKPSAHLLIYSSSFFYQKNFDNTLQLSSDKCYEQVVCWVGILLSWEGPARLGKMWPHKAPVESPSSTSIIAVTD